MNLQHVQQAMQLVIDKSVYTPICIWGKAGIGKTSSIKTICNDHN